MPKPRFKSALSKPRVLLKHDSASSYCTFVCRMCLEPANYCCIMCSHKNLRDRLLFHSCVCALAGDLLSQARQDWVPLNCKLGWGVLHESLIFLGPMNLSGYSLLPKADHTQLCKHISTPACSGSASIPWPEEVM